MEDMLSPEAQQRLANVAERVAPLLAEVAEILSDELTRLELKGDDVTEMTDAFRDLFARMVDARCEGLAASFVIQ